MAGTITIDTLRDGAGNSGSATDAIKGSARAWVNFNGTGTVSTNQTIRASHNVSSVFKNGTGDYTVNFSTAMPDANYCVSSSMSLQNTYTHMTAISSRVTTGVGISCKSNAAGQSSLPIGTDPDSVHVSVFR